MVDKKEYGNLRRVNMAALVLSFNGITKHLCEKESLIKKTGDPIGFPW